MRAGARSPEVLVDLIRRWLPLAAAIFFVTGTGYGIGQQLLRGGADGLPVQLAEDAAARLDAGATPAEVLPGSTVDVRRSLAGWVIVYGPDRSPIDGNARLDGGLPGYPTSAFDNATGSHVDTITWQPEPGTRAATAIVRYRGGWVVAGHSLRLVERQEQNLLLIAFAGGIAALLAAAVVILGLQLLLPTPGGSLNRQ